MHLKMNKIVTFSKPIFTKLSLAVIRDNIVYLSGQGPIDLATGNYTPGTIEEETLLTLQHIQNVLEAAGCAKRDVVKCTVYLRDLNDFEGYHRTFLEFFGLPTPARTTIGSNLLKNIRIEIDAIAHLPTPSSTP
jgi:2-iminobutanoate/2-iminopropanoate deaminase